MSWRIGIDVGGTFTDVMALHEETGREVVVKTPSTPDDFSQAFAAGVAAVLDKIGGDDRDVDMVFHGTTAATNAILQARYAATGLIVTEGYREILEVARMEVPGDMGDITWWIKPPRVVPVELVREVGGRLSFDGGELRPLDEDAVREIALEYRERGIDAIAVSLMHSYRNPAHEVRVRELVHEVHPDCFVSVSSDVIREYREYERTLSTCLNTGLMPLLSSYVDRLSERMEGSQIEAPLYIMKSSGGVAHAPELVTRPISACLSGPAAGVLAAAATSTALGHPDVLTLDMGGTSADIALIEGGAPRFLSEGRVDIYDIKVPMVDLTAVGAGGGSIAWLSEHNALRVGPQSAGSQPGPVCYGRGGTQPTVTDANVVLGRISEYLLEGEIRLDKEAAREAIREQIAEPLGLDVEAAAAGILEIAVNNMASGVRLVSIRRGRDPRAYSLFAFGGAGPLHGCLVADALGLSAVLVPVSPGATAAQGLHFADIRVDHVITDVQREDELDLARLNREFGDVRDKVRAELAGQGFEGERVRLESFVDLRYVGQAFEVRVPLPAGTSEIGADQLRDLVAAFHVAHEDQYGFSYAGKELTEVVNLGVTGFGLLSHPVAAELDGSSRGEWEQARTGTRPMYAAGSGGTVDTAVYARDKAPIGVPVAGPAIVEQYDSTTVVEPGWQVEVSPTGPLLITRTA